VSDRRTEQITLHFTIFVLMFLAIRLLISFFLCFSFFEDLSERGGPMPNTAQRGALLKHRHCIVSLHSAASASLA